MCPTTGASTFAVVASTTRRECISARSYGGGGMTDVPDPQPPAPEASVDELVEGVRSQIEFCWGDRAKAHAALDALAARLREAARERDDARGFCLAAEQTEDADMAALKGRLYAALKHEKSCTCGECSGGLNAVDDLVAHVERLERERDEAYRQAAQADEAHMLTGKRCRDALDALRQASDCCARPPGVCFDPTLADGGQENPAP